MTPHIPLVAVQLGLCLLSADFLSGVFHWWEDTYGSYQWPAALQRWIVVDNIAHHRTPAKFTRASWLYRNQIIVSVCAGLAILFFACGVRRWQAYLVLALSSLSNEIHAWAHRKTVPAPVAALQRLGLLQSRRHHGEHHRSPYAVRFCTTTNFLNPILDRLRFWRLLESLVSLAFGIAPKRLAAVRGGF